MKRFDVYKMAKDAGRTIFYRAWKVGRKGINAGEVAGTIRANGYRQLRIAGKTYLEHRLAWMFVYGVWPENHIDHINGVRDDNRIENLRDVDRSTNSQNQRHAQSHNRSSGLLGVSWNKYAKRWNAKIKFSGKQIHIGNFETKEQAHAAYIEAKKKHHAGCSF